LCESDLEENEYEEIGKLIEKLEAWSSPEKPI
jgi:hypothetical protein